ncbi:MAG: methyltransferase domain-containing protein [Phycisphaerales bacterium JB060]
MPRPSAPRSCPRQKIADDPAVSALNTQKSPPDPSQAWQPRAPRLPLVPQLRERLLDRTAAWLAMSGVTRIALYPGGRHTRAVIRQPWLFYGIEVAAVLDDQPGADAIAGVPVMTPDRAARAPGFQAVVLSTTEHEDTLRERAHAAFAGTAVRIVPLYLPDDVMWEAETTLERLLARGLSLDDARWLVDNRGERHDALLPIIPPARTELHARRYELAASIALDHNATRIADIASGTGYGSRLLSTIAVARTDGVDLDPQTVDYAQRHHAREGRCNFHTANACDTGLSSNTYDLAASFETIEHVENATGLVAELHRILKPGGTLVISTPNRIGPTPYHVHDFGFAEFAAMIESAFTIERWIGQSAADEAHTPDLPPGMWPIDPIAAMDERWASLGGGGGGKPQFLIAIARKGEARKATNHLDAITDWMRRDPGA